MTPESIRKAEDRYFNRLILFVIPVFLVGLFFDFFAIHIQSTLASHGVTADRKVIATWFYLSDLGCGILLTIFIQKHTLPRCSRCNQIFRLIRAVLKDKKCPKCGEAILDAKDCADDLK